MAGYFRNEPTCARCDYPRRLHHLLRAEHDYTERPKENAPGAAATAPEGNESDTHQNEGIMTHHTVTPASYLVIAVLAGIETIVSHTATFAGAVERSVSHATSYFGTTEFARYITDCSVVVAADDGQVSGYRIKPLDRPLPEGEPSAAEVDTIDDEDVHSLCTLCLTRIDVEQIPTLIDTLTELHRAWLHAGGAA